MVINLLPWRRACYKKRRRQILQILAAIIVCNVVLAAHVVQVHIEQRQQGQLRMTDLQQALRNAEIERHSRQHSYEMQLAKTHVLQDIVMRWQQNADWQTLMLEWGSLGKSIYVRQIVWADNRLQLFGEADDAGAIRTIKNLLPAQQQNPQIELAPSGKYQFMMSTEHESLSPVRGDS